jgi:DNA-damage-inducible protein J
MAKTTSMSVRIDDDLKRQSAQLFDSIGISLSTALTIFLKQAVAANGFPFAVSAVPNSTTVAAMREAEKQEADPARPKYDNVDDWFAALEAKCTD